MRSVTVSEMKATVTLTRHISIGVQSDLEGLDTAVLNALWDKVKAGE